MPKAAIVASSRDRISGGMRPSLSGRSWCVLGLGIVSAWACGSADDKKRVGYDDEGGAAGDATAGAAPTGGKGGVDGKGGGGTAGKAGSAPEGGDGLGGMPTGETAGSL